MPRRPPAQAASRRAPPSHTAQPPARHDVRHAYLLAAHAPALDVFQNLAHRRPPSRRSPAIHAAGAIVSTHTSAGSTASGVAPNANTAATASDTDAMHQAPIARCVVSLRTILPRIAP